MTSEMRPSVPYGVDVRRLPEKGFPVVVEADAKQCATLARAHSLQSVDSFRADLLVTKWKRDGISVRGRVVASIVQECVVTLEPIAALIDAPVDAVFVPEHSPLTNPQFVDGEVHLDVDGPDAPETYDGVSVDVGALAEEFFGLAIDPYPRAKGAALPETDRPRPEDSPFAVLARRSRDG